MMSDTSTGQDYKGKYSLSEYVTENHTEKK